MPTAKHLFFIVFVCFSFAKGIARETVAGDSLFVDTDTEVQQRTLPESFKDQYSSKVYDYTTKSNPDGWFSHLKNWFEEFIKDLFNLENRARASEVSQILLRVFYAFIILAVIFFIVKAILNKEGRWIFGKYSDKKILNIQDVENNIHQVDFKKLVEDAIASANYRLAVRYYYLWLLKAMTDKELIEYDVEKTNSDYAIEIKDVNIKKQFGYASYLYNYIWYGEFPIEKEVFEKAAGKFVKYINSIRK